MVRRHSKEGGRGGGGGIWNRKAIDRRQMDGIDGGLHLAMDGQSLDLK